MAGLMSAGGPGRRPRALPPGRIADLVRALDDLIVAAYGDGHRSGSRRRLIDAVNSREPGRTLTSAALSRQLGDLQRKPWGPDWSYIALIVTYCVPVGERGQEMARLAGLFCAARHRSRAPVGYTGPITWPDGGSTPALEDPDQAEDVATKLVLLGRNHRTVQLELEAAHSQGRHATAERERVLQALQGAHDELRAQTSAREAAERTVAELTRELAELVEEIQDAEQRHAQTRQHLDHLTGKVARLTALLTDETAARRRAETETATLRDQLTQQQEVLHTAQQRAADLNDMIGPLRYGRRPGADQDVVGARLASRKKEYEEWLKGWEKYARSYGMTPEELMHWRTWE